MFNSIEKQLPPHTVDIAIAAGQATSERAYRAHLEAVNLIVASYLNVPPLESFLLESPPLTDFH